MEDPELLDQLEMYVGEDVSSDVDEEQYELPALVKTEPLDEQHALDLMPSTSQETLEEVLARVKAEPVEDILVTVKPDTGNHLLTQFYNKLPTELPESVQRVPLLPPSKSMIMDLNKAAESSL